jgi:hypothetical protein
MMFFSVSRITTRPGPALRAPMFGGMCWLVCTYDGCEGAECKDHGGMFLCHECLRIVPWDSGGTDDLTCSTCWYKHRYGLKT